MKKLEAKWVIIDNKSAKREFGIHIGWILQAFSK
jgi:hypothetical protein